MKTDFSDKIASVSATALPIPTATPSPAVAPVTWAGWDLHVRKSVPRASLVLGVSIPAPARIRRPVIPCQDVAHACQGFMDNPVNYVSKP